MTGKYEKLFKIPLPSSKILEINEKAEKLNCIRFDKGSANFPFPKESLPIFKETLREIKGKYFHYPSRKGEKALREEIAILEENNKRKISAENIIITHGGMYGLTYKFLTHQKILRGKSIQKGK